jgi:hypothetical protein
MVRPVARLTARRARTSMRLRALDARDRLAVRGRRLARPLAGYLSVGGLSFPDVVLARA